MIEVELSRIIINEQSDQQMIFLREKGGERVVPIVIGYFEAAAIKRFVDRLDTERPMTHELLVRCIENLGAKLERVDVTELKGGTFFASLHLRRDGEVIEVDARPSDAIALATYRRVPIFVAERVIEDALRGEPDEEPEDE